MGRSARGSRVGAAACVTTAVFAVLALVVTASDVNQFRPNPTGWVTNSSTSWNFGVDQHQAANAVDGGRYATSGDAWGCANGTCDGANDAYIANASSGCAGSCAFTWSFSTSDPAAALDIRRIRVWVWNANTINVFAHDGDPAHLIQVATIAVGNAVLDTGFVTLDFQGATWAGHVQFLELRNNGSLDHGYGLYEVEAYGPPDPQPQSFGFDPSTYAYSNDPVNLGTGSFVAHASDLEIPGRVLPVRFERWYNSADSRSGALGPSWTHSYSWSVIDSGSTVEVRRGDGRRDTFTRNPDGTYSDPPNVFDVLTKAGDGTYALTLTSQVVYRFSSIGQLTSIREPAGNQVVLAYTGGSLTTITDTVGRQITLGYDTSSRLTQVQDPLGRRVTYAYDATGRLGSVVDKIGNAPGQTPAAHTWTYTYDGATSHLATITDPDGRVRVRNTYDAQGRVVEQRDGLNALTTIAYGTLQTTVTDPRGHPTTYAFDARMRVLSQVDAVGANTYTISYTYDVAGNRTSVTDRNGQRTDFTYDARGNVLTKTDPPPTPGAPRPATSFTYDAKNNLTQVTDPLTFATSLTYDPTTNVLLSVVRQIDATTSAVTSYAYGDAANPGLPTVVTSPRGFTTALAYDARGNLTSRTDPDAARTTFSYDTVGRLTSFVDPDGNAPGGIAAQHLWTIDYDENDRETARTDPLGHALTYNYDGSGRRIGITDRNGDLTFYAYDTNAAWRPCAKSPTRSRR
jgi:YD repeat-containing protein